MTAARRPPYDLEAEESLLGAMLLSRTAIEAATELVDATDFYKPTHGHVYDAVTHLHTRGEPADAVTVTDHLQRNGLLDTVGGQGTLIALQAATPGTGNAARYARIVAELALLRRMIAAAATIADIGYQRPEDVTAALDQAEQLIYNLGRPGETTTTRRLDTVITTALERLIERAEKGETIDGIATGWHDLDNLMAGLPAGDVTIVGARPAMGKTEFACNLAWQVAAEQGIPVVFASFEMTAEELAKRWLSNIAGVNRQSIRSARLSDDEWAALNASIASFQGVPIHVLDNFGANVAAIASAARRVGVAGGLVIVDYAQLVATAKSDNRNVEVADISRALKLMAGNLGCHVLLLSQLSRQLENRGDKRPILADLRDSGALEQDASNVLFLYRDEVYKGEKSKHRGVLEVICAKARNGPTGTVELFYRPHLGRIANIAFRTPPPQENP